MPGDDRDLPPDVRAALVRVVLGDVAAGRPRLSPPALVATRILARDLTGPAPEPATAATPRRVRVPARAAVAGAALAVGGLVLAVAGPQHDPGARPVPAPAARRATTAARTTAPAVVAVPAASPSGAAGRSTPAGSR